MSRDKYFKGYNPDFVSAYGKRDWQKDMEMCSQLDEWYEHPWEAGVEEGSNVIRIYEIIPEEPCVFVAECENDLTTDFIIDAREALPHWLQQYAAEKERGDKAEAREQKLREAAEKCINLFWEVTISDEKSLSSICDILTDVLDSLYPKEEETK